MSNNYTSRMAAYTTHVRGSLRGNTKSRPLEATKSRWDSAMTTCQPRHWMTTVNFGPFAPSYISKSLLYHNNVVTKLCIAQITYSSPSSGQIDGLVPIVPPTCEFLSQ
jgi:hypothetical protein